MLKHWLLNVVTEEDNLKDTVEDIFQANKREVEEMTSNISKGLEKLREAVRKEGKAEGKAELVIKQLMKKFKSVPNEYKEKIKNLTEGTIDLIATDIFDMVNIEDLLKYFG